VQLEHPAVCSRKLAPLVAEMLREFRADFLTDPRQAGKTTVVRELAEKTRMPKLHSVDAGLACHLLGLRAPEQLISSQYYGGLLENLIYMECCRAHQRKRADSTHRDSEGQRSGAGIRWPPQHSLQQSHNGQILLPAQSFLVRNQGLDA
jgi:Domain of unknown function (DUF4143)